MEIKIDDKGRWLYYNPALLAQMNLEVFERPIAREAFSFDQLLEIVSIENAENVLNSILLNPNSKKLLISIGKDSQSWQAKFQYLMDLEENKRVDIMNNFGDNGESLIQKELARRKEWFDSMERGYFEDEEDGITFDCEIDPNNILIATFGISYNDAKEIIKKYGIDIDKLEIQTDDDKKIYRKLQIIKELITPIKEESEYYKNYYYSHKEELLTLSKDISPFYKVDLEKGFFRFICNTI